MLQNSSNTEITYFNITFWSEEDVLGFKVSMKNLFIMHVVHSQGHLDKPCNDLVFREESSELLLFSYFMKHIASFAIVHDDAETPLLCDDYIFSMKD